MKKFNSDKIVKDILGMGKIAKEAHEKRKKPLDKAIEAYEKRTWDSYCIKDIEKLKKDKVTLKTSLSKAGEFIESLKTENKLQAAQLFKLGQAVDKLTGRLNNPLDKEK